MHMKIFLSRKWSYQDDQNTFLLISVLDEVFTWLSIISYSVVAEAYILGMFSDYCSLDLLSMMMVIGLFVTEYCFALCHCV